MRRLLPLFLCLVLLLSACGATAVSGDGQQTRIVLNGNSASVTGGGVKVSGSVISIGAAGSYIVSGTLDDGQLVVDTGDEAMDVWLTLDNASISNRGGAALYVKQAKNLYLSTLSGTKNRLVSGTEADMAAYDGTQDGAALFSEDDLKLSGEGAGATDTETDTAEPAHTAPETEPAAKTGGLPAAAKIGIGVAAAAAAAAVIAAILKKKRK